MRARDIDQRTTIFLDVGQEEPRLERRVEGIRMELDLRIFRSLNCAPEDRLDVIEGSSARARDISDEIAPARAVQQTRKSRNAAIHFRIDGDAAGDCVALLLRSALELGVENGLPEPAEILLRKHVPENDETVPIELRAQVRRNGSREASPAKVRKRVSDLEAPDVEACTIEDRRAEDRVVDEGFRAGEESEEPERSAPPRHRSAKGSQRPAR